MKHVYNIRKTRLSIYIALLFCSAVPLLAQQNDTWNGGGAPNGSWSAAANWNGTAPKATGDNLIFSGNNQAINTNNLVTSVGWIQLNPSTPFTVSGTALTINSGFTNSAQNNIWSIPLALGASQNFDVAAGTALTNTAVISGSGKAITTTSPGTLVLAGMNTYTGGTTINSGTTLQLNSPAGAGVGGTIVNNGTLALVQGGFNFTNPVSGSGTINVLPSALGVGGDAEIKGSMANFNGVINIGYAGVARFVTVTATALSAGTTINVTTNGQFYPQSGGCAASVNISGTGDGDGLGALRFSGDAVNGAITLMGNSVAFYVNTSGSVNGPIGDGGLGYGFTMAANAASSALTINSTNTYSGNTTISNGVLILGATGSILNSPIIKLASSTAATFNVSAVTGFSLNNNNNQTISGSGKVVGDFNAPAGTGIIPGGINAAGTLAFGNNLTLNNQTLTFDLSANPASGNDVITVTGTLANNGTVLISLSQLAGSLGVGTYTLMTYGSLAGNGTFALTGTYPGNVSLNVGANSLTLIVSNTAPNLVWVGDGAANNWNLTTANWLNGTTPAAFGQNNNVSFTDSGSATPNINLTTSLFPGTVTVNSSQAYTFDGSGQLSGLGLVINGSGTLILNTSNNYTNGTVINSGTVQLGNNGPAGSLAGTIINNSQLVFDHNSTNTMTNTISGTGTLTVNGSGLEILTASNTFSGGTIINAGTLQLNSLTAGGSGPIADNSSVNLLAGGFKFLNAFSGSGIINIVPAQSSYSVSNVSYDYAQFNGPLNLNATINVPFGPGVARVVTTAANLTASSVTINVTNNGELYVQTGTLAATVNLAGAGYGDGLGAIRLTGTLSGTVNLTGNATIAGPGTFSGTIGDNGNGYSLKISSRVITYSGVTSQNFGDTIINTNAGLTLINGAAVENSAAIDIGPGATFNVSADSVATYPIPTGLGDGAVAQTLASTGENGIINGNVTLGSGGSLAVTIANDGQPSLLVTNGTLTLADNPVIVTASALSLTGGTYPLVAIATNGTVGSVSGDVSASTLTIAGAGLGNGATASLLLADSVLYLVVNQPTPAPAIFGSVSPLPGNGGFQLIFSGSNGHNYSILTTTNLTLPLASWQTLATGSFGSVLVTNTDLTATNSPQRFYDILSQ